MRIIEALQYFFYRDPCDEEPRLKKHELFQADGWGPRPAQTLKPGRYRGPLYPAPMHPKGTSSLKSAELCNAARNAWSAKRLNDAEEKYAAALREDPKNSDFRFELAQLKWSEGHLSEAKELLEDVIKAKPSWYPALVSLFRVSIALGDKKRAGEVYNELLGYQGPGQWPWPVMTAAGRQVYHDILGH